MNNYLGKSFILMVDRSFTYRYSESYIFACTIGYHNKCTINQLAGTHDNNGHVITKIRVVVCDDQYSYIDIYVDITNAIIGLTGFGGIYLYPNHTFNPEIPSGWTTIELETNNGTAIKST